MNTTLILAGLVLGLAFLMFVNSVHKRRHMEKLAEIEPSLIGDVYQNADVAETSEEDPR